LKQTFNIVTPGDGSSEKTLSLKIGVKHFGFVVTSMDATELYRLSWCTGEDIELNSLTSSLHEYPELKKEYASVKICYDTPNALLVPHNYYHDEESRNLLRQTHVILSNEHIEHDMLNEWQMHNLFAVPGFIYKTLMTRFPDARWYHEYTVGIRNLDTTLTDGAIAADFGADYFSVVVSKGSRIVLAHTYCYSAPADVLFYLLKITQEFGLSQETLTLTLTGLIDRQSALFRELYQYFIHVSFREPTWNLASAEQSEYPAHFFTTLNDLARCGS
jgi:hypothetical protein